MGFSSVKVAGYIRFEFHIAAWEAASMLQKCGFIESLTRLAAAHILSCAPLVTISAVLRCFAVFWPGLRRLRTSIACVSNLSSLILRLHTVIFAQLHLSDKAFLSSRRRSTNYWACCLLHDTRGENTFGFNAQVQVIGVLRRYAPVAYGHLITTTHGSSKGVDEVDDLK